jgi:hypothetical protein
VASHKIIDRIEEFVPTAQAEKFVKEFFFEVLQVNRWRATWLNGEGTLQIRVEQKKNKENNLKIAEQKRIEKKRKTGKKETKNTKL